MAEGSRPVSKEKQYDHVFSICSIITDAAEYGLMKQSFLNSGFDAGTEYLFADNTGGNVFDAYSAINIFLQDARGRYIIIVHQDVRCIDRAGVLLQCLNGLEAKDPAWAVCGNAGANGYKHSFYHMNDNGRLRHTDHLPAKVTSLDENLLIVKNSSNLSVSADIGDFHFYGTDICMVADFLGYSCYVIPFMVDHLSSGNLQKMAERQPFFIEKYGHKLRHRFIQTSCTKFYLSNAPSRNRFYNNRFIFFWVKAFTRLGNLFRR
jgi:hypothetical protein